MTDAQSEKIYYLRDGRSPVPNNDFISKIMSANKAKGTSPEKMLRHNIYLRGMRGFRVNYKVAATKPDIVFTKQKLAIFVNGCFWHRCPYCKLQLPKTHSDFWNTKFENNRVRDKRNASELKRFGWAVLVLWECQIKNDIGNVVHCVEKNLLSLPSRSF